MANLIGIQRLSLWLYRLCSLAMLALPLGFVMAALWGVFDGATLRQLFPTLPMETAITPTKSLIAAGFFAATLALVLLALFWMRDLFNRYRRGEILTAACATAILRIGQVLFAQALWAILMPTLLVLALTADNPAGHKILQIGLSSESLGLILTAALFITIGAVMHEAARIAEENAGFI